MHAMKTGSHKMTKRSMRNTLFAHSTLLGLITAGAVTLYLFVDVIAWPRVRDGTSLEAHIIVITRFFYCLFTYSMLAVSVVLSLCRKIFLSVCYLAAGATACVSCFAAAAL
jgi:hypothetical protein